MDNHNLSPGDTFDTLCGPVRIVARLGKGKSGVSYRVEDGAGRHMVLKVIHHEPVGYYGFGADKLGVEVRACQRLTALGVPVPELIAHDAARDYLLKVYVAGPTAAELIAAGGMTEPLLAQLFALANRLEPQSINLDYFPTNFVVAGDELVYVDYEINPFTEPWSLRRWGIYYWLNAAGWRAFLDTGDASAINADVARGLPITAPFEAEAARLAAAYGIREGRGGSRTRPPRF